MFRGETVNGLPHGIGDFKWGNKSGIGNFNNGLLHGHALVYSGGDRWSCDYREGTRSGFGKDYCPAGYKGIVSD